MSWGHAISNDLIHWRQLAPALLPYENGLIYSGSAVFDGHNSSGLGNGGNGPLVAAFTHARKPFGQAIATSHDIGRTWQLYKNGGHVVPNQGLDDEERDPRIFWFEPAGHWIMVLWIKKNQVRFFISQNLLDWRHASDFVGDGFYECPDFVQLPIDGDPHNTKWVLYDAAFHYWVGTFDGKKFTAEEGPLIGEYGANFYAAQTWNNTGSRVIQIGWMDGGEYPGMPFNQQLSIPCELTLRKTDYGFRIHRTPVKEVSVLRIWSDTICDTQLDPGPVLVIGEVGDLFDIESEFAVAADSCFEIQLYNLKIIYSAGQIQFLDRCAPLLPKNGNIRLRLLVDRTSIELFGNGGIMCMTSCFIPSAKNTDVRCRVLQGSLLIRTFTVHHLDSIWSVNPQLIESNI